VNVDPAVHRGGVLTQASILSVTSNGTRTSPVKRGTWVLKNLLDRDPGLPVANVGEIKPKVPGIDKATVRQRLAIHRELDQCARCHDKIDPIGLAMENFNAAGEWRDQEGFGYKGRIEPDDPKIDATATLADGRGIDGIAGLQTYLLDNKEDFLRCLAQKLFGYALGRELSYADKAAVQQVVERCKQQGYSLNSMLVGIVLSDAMLRK
jgi:hypothetical protein